MIYVSYFYRYLTMADTMPVISEEQHCSISFSLCSEAKLHNIQVEFVFFSSLSENWNAQMYFQN